MNIGIVKNKFAPCISVETKASKLFLDCGKIQKNTPSIPNFDALDAKISDYDMIFVSHLHWDHFGGVQYLWENGFEGQIIVSRETGHILKSWIQNGDMGISREYGSWISRHLRVLNYFERTECIRKLELTLFPSWHSIGAAMLHLEDLQSGHTLLYTGDMGLGDEATTRMINDRIELVIFDGSLFQLKKSNDQHQILLKLGKIVASVLNSYMSVVFPLFKLPSLILVRYFSEMLRAGQFNPMTRIYLDKGFFGSDLPIFPENVKIVKDMKTIGSPAIIFTIDKDVEIPNSITIFTAFGNNGDDLENFYISKEFIDWGDHKGKSFKFPFTNHFTRHQGKEFFSNISCRIAVPFFSTDYGMSNHLKSWWEREISNGANEPTFQMFGENPIML